MKKWNLIQYRLQILTLFISNEDIIIPVDKRGKEIYGFFWVIQEGRAHSFAELVPGEPVSAMWDKG